jgi:hypothetical protein
LHGGRFDVVREDRGGFMASDKGGGKGKKASTAKKPKKSKNKKK